MNVTSNYVGRLCSLLSPRKNIFTSLNILGVNSTRNTFILKRRYPVPLCKKGEENFRRPLKGRHYVYDLVEDTELKKRPEVQVLLKEYVEGLGNKGDVVTVSRNTAYDKLLLTGLADFLPDDIKEEDLNKQDDAKLKYSTITAPMVVKFLEKKIINVVMNKETEWTVKPWHIRASFRKAGIYLNEDSITLPAEPISGPNLDLELKEFIVKIKVNQKEEANVRCRIHHWSTSPVDRLPWLPHPWTLPSQPLFKEDLPIIEKLPVPPPPPSPKM